MKLLMVLLFAGATLATQYIDGEFLFNLEKGVTIDQFSVVLRQHNLELIKSFDFPSGLIVWVKGDDAVVESVGKRWEVVDVTRNQMYFTQQCNVASHPQVWGLDRVDQVDRLSYDSPIDPNAVYDWGQDNGDNVKAYVVDTGIAISDPEFQGRATYGINTIRGGDPPEDDNGHGTHCSGTIGSRSYGLAKSSSLVAVKVLGANGAGSTGNIVDGLDWVLVDHGTTTDARSVVNMSLGGAGSSAAMELAVRNLVNGGVVVVVAAGNSDGDACNYTPAQEPLAITVGASDVSDTSASFTNYGTCLDIFAPGVNIKSTWLAGDTNVISGTSMACPHVVGVVARYQSSQATAPTPADVDAWLKANASSDKLSWNSPAHATSPNELLFGPCILP